MKALKIAAILLAALISAIYVAAEVEVINITLKDGTVEQHKISDIDQIIFEDHLILNALPVPENVQAAAGEGVVNITWSAVVGADDYAVYRTADGITYLQIGTTSSTSYIDDTPLVGSNSYAVQAFGPDEHMSPKSPATDPVVKLAAPANVAGEQTSGSVALTWDVVSGATSYTIFRSADGSTFAQIGTSATNSFSDTHPKIGDNYYRVVASASGCLSSNMSESSEAVEVTAQEEIGTHDYVNLGLPSGLLWATCNVGAERASDYGDYFAWGETEPKTSYTNVNSDWYNVSFSQMLAQGVVDADGILASAYDAAKANWGGDWRMPTLDETWELINNCSWTFTTLNGVSGLLVTGPNGNTIFLPYGGYRYGTSKSNVNNFCHFWTSKIDSSAFDTKACSMYAGSYSRTINNSLQWNGLNIRPVKSASNVTPPTPTLAAPESVQGVVSDQTINVSWSAVTNATSYKVFRSTDGTNFTQIRTSDTTSFTDNSPNEGYNYYKVQALGANDLESEQSAASAAVTYTAPVTPPTPVNHDSVDLGLPSGLLWATCNIGASTPTECGGFYAWGETQPRTSFTQNESTWYSTMMGSLISQGVIDANYQLTPAHDAAKVNWGGDWRMPTQAEVQELIDNCTWEWGSQGDRNGYTVTGPSGSSIFFPCYGYYYSTSPVNDNAFFYIWTSKCDGDYNSINLNGGRNSRTGLLLKTVSSFSQSNGHNIRPVKSNNVAE